MYVVKYACDGKRFGMYETKEEAQKAVLANVEEAPEMKRSIFDFTLKEQTTSWKDIKTFDDAVACLGNNNKYVEAYHRAIGLLDTNAAKELLGVDVIAFLKLRIITAAINEGWNRSLQKTNGGIIHGSTSSRKKNIAVFLKRKSSGVCCVLVAMRMRVGGLVYASAFVASTNSYTSVGARLAFESEEKAKHAGVYFKELWADFCFREAEKK